MIDPELLRELIDYNPETGAMTWLERPESMFPRERLFKMWNTRYANTPALNYLNHHGYLVGWILGRRYQSHRVAWAIHYGEWPDGQIDHINHDRSDNRITNLRVVTNQENHKNMSHRCDNTSGVVGVYWYKRTKKWKAEIRVSGRCIHLGYFKDFDKAVTARKEAERRYDFHENHGAEA